MTDKEFATLYFIGVHYPINKHLSYNVKGRAYTPEYSNGKLVVGGIMKVAPQDVKVIIDKSRIFKRNQGFFETFTTDPQIAAAVKQRFDEGKTVSVSARMTVQQASQLVGVTASKEDVLNEMTVSDLQAEIERRLGNAEDKVKVSDDNTVDKQPEKKVETPVKPTGNKRKQQETKTVDEILS
jgi:hypothetical protein